MSPLLERGDPDWLHLAADERVVWESRPHVVAMGRAVPAGVALALVGLALLGLAATNAAIPATPLELLGVALGALGAFLVLARYVAWTNTRYVLTTGELYEKRGVVSRDVTQFRLDRVQNTSLEQSVVGRLLGYGHLTIYTAGSGDPELVYEYVPRPERAGRALSRELVSGTVGGPANRSAPDS